MRELCGEWVDVAESLPQNGVKVLCAVNDIISEWQEVLYYDGMEWSTTNDEDFPCIVTHWKPLGPNP